MCRKNVNDMFIKFSFLYIFSCLRYLCDFNQCTVIYIIHVCINNVLLKLIHVCVNKLILKLIYIIHVCVNKVILKLIHVRVNKVILKLIHVCVNKVIMKLNILSHMFMHILDIYQSTAVCRTFFE